MAAPEKPIVNLADVPLQDFGKGDKFAAKIARIVFHPDVPSAEVIVPNDQLSLAIGKKGQNARLAARLTGIKIDIKNEEQHAQEERA